MLATIRPLVWVSLFLFAGLAAARCTLCSAADSPEAQRMKAEFERKRAEQKRKFEQLSREMKAKARTGVSTTPAAPAFDVASAPPPAECLKAYLAAARGASSMEQVLPYLPEAEQKGLRAHQSSYDPQVAAKGREWHRQQNPKISEETLTHLSNPPFTNALKFHQGLAHQIIDVLSVKIDGNKAELVVSTSSGATVNGDHYGYGTADVEMIGEGRTWKLSRYKPSIMVYKDVPQ